MIGPIIKKRGFINAYLAAFTVHVLFNILSGAFSLYRFFQHALYVASKCIDNSTDGLATNTSQKGMSIMEGVLIAVLVFVWLMEIWGRVIVNDYSRQLGEEETMAQRYEESGRKW